MLATLKERKLWDIYQFEKVNLPEVVHELMYQQSFMKQRGFEILDMPIYMPGQGWRVPEEFQQFDEMLGYAQAAEMRYEGMKDHYCYITIDQRKVRPGETQRRPGCHSDSFIEKYQSDHEVDHIYICYDSLPTHFFDCPFYLDDWSHDGSMDLFEKGAWGRTPVTYPPFTVLRLDPYMVHRAAITLEPIERTFVKLQFSKKIFNRLGNSINAEFEYNWDMVARGPLRNDPWAPEED